MIERYQVVLLLLAGISGTIVTLFTTPLFISLAYARDILDRPTSLKNHKRATPYLGGLAIYSSFIIILALFFPVYWNLSLFLIGLTLLLLVGLVDDLVPLSPAYKFWGQMLAMLCFIKGGFSLKQEFLGTFSHSGIPFLLMLISALWILSLVNAFNLIDIMDGLAATCALTILINFLFFASSYSLYSISLLVAIGIGVLSGFLWFNKSPAKIYLGDAGSLFIGGLIASIPFMIPWGTYTLVGFLAPVIVLGVPLVEVLFLILIRTYKGIPFYKGSRDHFAHYLLDKGWSKSSILALVSCTNILLGAVAYLFNREYITFTTTLTLLSLLLVAWTATIYSTKKFVFSKN